MSIRNYTVYVGFDWDFDDTFTNESSRLVSVSVDRSIGGISNPLTGGSGRVDKATIELKNFDNRYSSKIAVGGGSSISSYVANGGIYLVPVRIEININSTGAFRIFTGVCSIPVETSLSINRPKTISITAFSNEETFRNNKFSLPIDDAYTFLSNLPNESTAIAYLLNTVGLSGTLDPGLYTVFPYADNSSLLETIWKLAKVSGGYFFTDRNGGYIYRNSSSFADVTSTETFTENDYGLATMIYDDINLSKKVVISGSVPTTSTETLVYTHGKVIIVPPGETVELSVNYNNYLYNISGFNYSAVSFGGSDLSGDITFTHTNYINKSDLSFENTGSNTVLITGFKTYGYEINITQFEVAKEINNSFWSDRSTSDLETKIQDNFLVSVQSADSIAQMMADRQALPLPTFNLVDLVYNSPVELLEKFTIDDSSVSDDPEEFFVTKVSYRISFQSGLRLSLEGVSATTLYPYITEGYFILGTNELGSSATGKARMFY